MNGLATQLRMTRHRAEVAASAGTRPDETPTQGDPVSTTEAMFTARENVLRAALDSLRAERRLADDDSSVLTSLAADEKLALACRGMVQAVLDLPFEKRPKGWTE